jgi:hypothetical protein
MDPTNDAPTPTLLYTFMQILNAEAVPMFGEAERLYRDPRVGAGLMADVGREVREAVAAVLQRAIITWCSQQPEEHAARIEIDASTPKPANI